MRIAAAILLAASLAVPWPGVTVRADELRNQIAPYRFQPTSPPKDALEQQKMLSYRNRLDAQRLQLERNQAVEGFSLDRQRLLMDTNRELGRIDQGLQR